MKDTEGMGRRRLSKEELSATRRTCRSTPGPFLLSPTPPCCMRSPRDKVRGASPPASAKAGTVGPEEVGVTGSRCARQLRQPDQPNQHQQVGESERRHRHVGAPPSGKEDNQEINAARKK